ncbi:protein GLUTAMINE DUMPER 4-like [Prunus yedoensis var. nudiflora]|uniref:Protein GLUTAMINE DUMPER 4-like n=1 Tax=Prunus yedoensis var. nudiflora TaxID=2094558 RepID=A0A314UPD3_PRUYE|nr:protein GLUTAMINE DUMPER 4-like [Prunus yedoensis var. nudiflora]
MMPSANSTAAATGHDAVLRNWKSPIPYLFGGLALMLGLVAVALLILACSFHRTPSSNSSTSSDADQDQKPTRPVDIEAADSEPKIVVIMAGEKTATYLAKPMCSNTHQTDQNV